MKRKQQPKFGDVFLKAPPVGAGVKARVAKKQPAKPKKGRG